MGESAKGLRVAIDATPAMKAEPSGVAHYIRHLVGALAEAAEPNDRFSLCYRLSRWERRAHRLPLPRTGFSQRWVQGWLRPRGRDVAHGPDGRLFEAGSARRVVTLHDLFALEENAGGAAAWRQKMAARYRLVASQADRVLCVSAWTRSRFLHHHPDVDAERVRVVPPGVSEAFSPRAREGVPALRRTLGLEGPYALFLGALNSRKNPDVLLDAWAQLPEEAGLLVLAGADGGRLAPLRNRVVARWLTSRVRFLGHVDDPFVPSLLAGATCLLMPSYLEGFGLPALEALACGTPVVHSARGGLAEAVGPHGIVIDPEDPDAIAAAVLRILDDEAERNRLVANGLAHAQRFDWRETARLTLEAYREV